MYEYKVTLEFTEEVVYYVEAADKIGAEKLAYRYAKDDGYTELCNITVVQQ